MKFLNFRGGNVYKKNQCEPEFITIQKEWNETGSEGGFFYEERNVNTFGCKTVQSEEEDSVRRLKEDQRNRGRTVRQENNLVTEDRTGVRNGGRNGSCGQ